MPAALLPRRRWPAFDSLPIERLSLVSALFALGAGVALGVDGFLVYASRAADGLAAATLDVAAHQTARPAGPEISTAAPVAISIFSLVAFLLTTAKGWLTIYLLGSGTVRAVGSLINDPAGDPLLSVLDSLLTRASRRVRSTSSRRARERLEGPETPDFLFTGERAGVPAADYVVIASRRKPDWTAGTFIITSDKWYTLGEPFDMEFPQGLRSAYPLTEQKVCEVLRRGIAYELPRLIGGRRPSP